MNNNPFICIVFYKRDDNFDMTAEHSNVLIFIFLLLGKVETTIPTNFYFFEAQIGYHQTRDGFMNSSSSSCFFLFLLIFLKDVILYAI